MFIYLTRSKLFLYKRIRSTCSDNFWSLCLCSCSPVKRIWRSSLTGNEKLSANSQNETTSRPIKPFSRFLRSLFIRGFPLTKIEVKRSDVSVNAKVEFDIIMSCWSIVIFIEAAVFLHFWPFEKINKYYKVSLTMNLMALWSLCTRVSSLRRLREFGASQFFLGGSRAELSRKPSLILMRWGTRKRGNEEVSERERWGQEAKEKSGGKALVSSSRIIVQQLYIYKTSGIIGYRE